MASESCTGSRARAPRVLSSLFVLLVAGWLPTTFAAQSPEAFLNGLATLDSRHRPAGAGGTGESIDLYTGSLGFVVTDVSLPGNSDLPVALTRRFAVGSPGLSGKTLALGDWSLDVPVIQVMVPGVAGNWPGGWRVHGALGSDHEFARCSYFGKLPSVSVPGGLFEAKEYSSGVHLDLPGYGRQTLLSRASANNHSPSMSAGGQPLEFPVVTKNDTMARCIPLANGPGEGFLVVTPDGRQWRFDYLAYGKTLRPVRKPANGSSAMPQGNPNAQMDRWQARLYATKVTDRFGHWVEYHYDVNDHLTRIESDDGRRIDIAWQNGVVHTVTAQPLSAAPRSWTYTITGSSPATRTLSVVSGPESTVTEYDLHALARAVPLGISSGCGAPQAAPHAAQSGNLTGTVTTPAGLTVTYSLGAEVRGHADTPHGCWQGYVATHPKRYRVLAVQTREAGGAGVPTRTWHYDYSTLRGSWDWECGGGSCPFGGTVWTHVTDPNNHVTKYTYSNRFDATEGQLLKTRWYGDSHTLLRTETRTYADANSGAWPSRYGVGSATRGNALKSMRRSPLKSRTISEGGIDYQWQATSFNGYARPDQITRSRSGPNAVSVEASLAYDNNVTRWVLGQPERRTLNTPSSTDVDPVPVERTYRASNATLQTISRFSQTVASYTWYTTGGGAGQLKSYRDGLSQTTHYSSYHYGVPTTAIYADNTRIELTTNAFGEVLTVTDEREHTTTVQRDGLGRITDKSFPDESAGGPTWAPVHIAYRNVTTDAPNDGLHEYGLAGRHWHVTVTQGSARKDMVYDAALNPVVTSARDIGTQPDQGTMTWQQSDFAGRTTFASYPLAWADTLPVGRPGVSTRYDALGRVIRTLRDAEFGPLITTTDYLSGHKATVTNPRGDATTTTYQAFDTPAYGKPVKVEFADGTVTTVTRDRYGKPITMTQSGDYAGYPARSVTHHFHYDRHERLCLQVSPETGRTGTGYDANGRLTWSAQGLAVSQDPCAAHYTPSDAKTVHRSYDARNRLLKVNYPAGEPDTTFTYAPDGKVLTATRGGATWTRTYFNRGLLKTDTLSIDGHSFDLHYDYDTLGHLASEQYPSGRIIHYTPNALGQPTHAGPYATGLDYAPNGRLTDLVYGNGITYHASYTTRNLLETVQYQRGRTALADRTFTWDANGNPLSITDSVGGSPAAPDTVFRNGFELPQAPGTDDRSYTYDRLDRLTQAVSGRYGTRHFRYDPLGNLRQRQDAAPRPDITYHYGSLNRLTTTSTGFAFGYDARGNVTGFGPASLDYNHANDMVSYDLTSPSRHVTYAYDARGWRVKTTANGSTTYFIYDANHHLVARQKNGTLTEVIHLGSRPIARIEGTTTTYIHTNYQHSPLFETDANGTITRRPFYLAYGVTTEEGRSNIPGYAGSAPDTLTDLSYMGARYYYPLFSRFLSPDPAPLNPRSPVGLNRYAYGNDNPARYVDPLGLQACSGSGANGDACEQEREPDRPNGCNITRPCFFDGSKWHTPSSGSTIGSVLRGSSHATAAPVSVPVAPSGVSLNRNILLGRYIGIITSEAQALAIFYVLVRGDGMMDYLQLGQQYERFGNFNYGAVGSAMGIPSWLLYRAAGAYQLHRSNSLPKWGSPLGAFPYGDDPLDQKAIQNGIIYYEHYDAQHIPWYVPYP